MGIYKAISSVMRKTSGRCPKQSAAKLKRAPTSSEGGRSTGCSHRLISAQDCKPEPKPKFDLKYERGYWFVTRDGVEIDYAIIFSVAKKRLRWAVELYEQSLE